MPVAERPNRVTRGLLAANVLVFVVMGAAGVMAGEQSLSAFLSSPDPGLLLRFGAKYGPAILAGDYWRLMTAIWIHSGLLHLGLNCYGLYIMGTETERFFGRARTLIIYLLAGVASVIASYMADGRLAVGASGAIFGLVGALAIFFLRNRRLFGAMGRRVLGNLALIVLLNLIFGLTVAGIDNWAHMGGLAAGLLLAWALAPQYEVVLPGRPILAADGGIIHVRAEDRNPLRRRRWVVPAAVLLGVGLTMVGNAREGQSASGHQLRGETYLRQGETARAIDAFSAALALDGENWGAVLLRGEAYLQAGEWEAAGDDFETVIASTGPSRQRAIAYTGRARIHLIFGRTGAALADVDRAVELAPAEPFAHLVRGVIYYEIGEFAPARADLQRALDLGLADEQSIDTA
ncbi:MAG: rhomboid family intramembrane serine protease, partial [Chloroflexota bacterium]